MVAQFADSIVNSREWWRYTYTEVMGTLLPQLPVLITFGRCHDTNFNLQLVCYRNPRIMWLTVRSCRTRNHSLSLLYLIPDTIYQMYNQYHACTQITNFHALTQSHFHYLPSPLAPPLQSESHAHACTYIIMIILTTTHFLSSHSHSDLTESMALRTLAIRQLAIAKAREGVPVNLYSRKNFHSPFRIFFFLGGGVWIGW